MRASPAHFSELRTRASTLTSFGSPASSSPSCQPSYASWSNNRHASLWPYSLSPSVTVFASGNTASIACRMYVPETMILPRLLLQILSSCSSPSRRLPPPTACNCSWSRGGIGCSRAPLLCAQ
ncbi:hypothetical protein BV20DRAFT_683674 [Pilatotrama ljubarskyi]|nr:hypothetical protein BV20DRAFT_683674 [Pilatotrama ljubarskyi]